MRRLAMVHEIPIWGLRFLFQQGKIEEQGLLLRLANGEVRAFKNECRHLPMRLDARAPHQLWDTSGALLHCCSHGALFRPEDGLCIEGPCTGERLEQLPIRVEQGAVLLQAPASAGAEGGSL